MADYYDERDDGGGVPHLYGIPLPITAPRGGIKYPTPVKLKGTPVAKTLNQQLADLVRQHTEMGDTIEVLRRKVKTQRKSPPTGQSMWSIDVRFTSNGTAYKYLILRHGARYYSTGTGEDRVFYSWDSLLGWLDGVSAHGPLVPLTINTALPNPLEGRA